MMNLSDDTEELEDIIRLDFPALQASKNIQLLDPGIIDLECDSEDECTSISLKEPESFHAQPDLHSPVTTSHSNTVDLKPMCIKVVDCYKFPWYFDKFKDIIEHKIATNQSVEVDAKILDHSSTDPAKELVGNTNFDDMSVVDSVTMQRQADACRKEVATLNKEIDFLTAKELLENKKTTTGTKSVRNNLKINKMDYDIQRAMEQRKNSVVDLKRNIGLVGMKILRLPNKLPMEISINKQFKKPTEANNENSLENKQEKGTTSSSHVKALDKVLINASSTTPLFQETVEGVKESELIPESFIRSISALVETETNSNDTTEVPILSVNKIAEEIYRLVRPHKYAGNISQSTVPNSCNTMITPTIVSKENFDKRFKYQSQKYIAEGTRTTKLIDPIPISPKKRNKDRMKSHLQTKASEIIDISDQMSPKSPSKTSEKTSSIETITVSNKEPENMQDHKRKEINSKYKPSTLIAKPKIVLSTKKPNKLTETIFKIKEKQQKESSISEATKSLNSSSNTIPSSTLSRPLSETRSLTKKNDTDPNYKNVGTQEQQLNEHDKSKYIKSSSPKITIAQLQYSNINDYENAASKDNHPQNTSKNKISTDANILSEAPEKKAEQVSENNHPESAQIVTESSTESHNTSNNNCSQSTEKIIVEVKLIDSTKEKLKQHHGTDRFPAVNPIETATNNFAIPTIVSNRETIISCMQFDAAFNHYSNVSNPAVNATKQVNQSPVTTEPLTVYNSMQAHTLYKPSDGSYQNFRQNQCNAVRFPSHKPRMNQPIYNNTGQPLQNSTHHAREISTHIDTTPPSSGVNEKILPQIFHRLPMIPMPPLPPTNFGAPMLHGIRPNMPTRMRHPGPNGGFGAQLSSNPRPMSLIGVTSQTSSQMPMNYPQILMDEMQSYDVLWSGPFSCMPPPPPPLPTNLPAPQDLSTSSPKSRPQTIDSSIIGRNINGIVKKINISAPVIEHKEEIDSKAGIIKIENLECDASTPLYDEISNAATNADCFENIEPVKTKKEMLRILDTGLQKVFSRSDVSSPADGNQNKVIQHSTINDTPNNKKENLLYQGNLGKSPNKTTHQKCNSGTRKTNSAIQNFIKIDRVPSKEQKYDKSPSQKKENPHKSNHYLMNFIKKPKEKKDKKKKIPTKKCNESLGNKAAIVAELAEHESNNKKTSAYLSSCIPKHNEITKNPTSNHLKCIQDSKKGHTPIKLPDKRSKTTFEDLFGDGMDDADFEKVASDKKSTGKRHSGVMNTEKTSEKSSVNLKRPANDEKPALSPKYRPGPLSKRKKLNDQERVNPHQINKKQILQSKTYSDPILPIPTYEKILSNMPSYLCFRDDMKNSSVSSNSRYKNTSCSVNPKIPDTGNKRDEKAKEKLKLDKAESIKKISINEYKKRSTSVRKVDIEAKDYYKKKHVEMHRRPSHADSDLGYDSDSTVKL